MSTHRKCCKCGCAAGSIVRPQPCNFSSAYSHTDEVTGINVSHWDISCIPYFDCEYIKTKIEESETGIISFAFQGACWFFDGKETRVDTCDIYECQTPDDTGETFTYGFNLIVDDPLEFYYTEQDGDIVKKPTKYWYIEGIYDSCDECENEEDSNGNRINEHWYKFELCNCEADFYEEGPPGGPGGIGPGATPKPDGDNGKLPGNEPCDEMDDYCMRAFDDKPIYIPARYMPSLMEIDCCADGTGPGTNIPCITPDGCNDPLEKCHYWKEPISWILEQPGKYECCLKSCTEGNAPDIVTHIPCGLTEDPNEGTFCHCLGLWTPFLYHTLEGGEEQGDRCEFEPITWNREDSELHGEPTENNPIHRGARQRGCCQCCCGPPCRNLTGNWDYCRAFEGMSTFEITVELSDDDQVGGQLPGEPCQPWTYGYFPCPMGIQIVTYKFDLYPEVAETEDPPLNEMLNVTDCIQLNLANINGIQADCMQDWEDGQPVYNVACNKTPIGACNIYLHNTCYSAWLANNNYPEGKWYHELLYTNGNPSGCNECLEYWYPDSGEPCPPSNPALCPWCHTGDEEEGDNIGDPCCSDEQGFCEGQPIYVTKSCKRSQGGTYGYNYSSYGLKWGHYDFCREPEEGVIVGMRIAFTHHGGDTGYPGVVISDSSSTGAKCCSDNCGDSCGTTAGCGSYPFTGWGCGEEDGSFNCPYTFCFILPDDRVAGEGPECLPIGYAASGSTHGDYGKDDPPDHLPEDGIHPDGLEKPSSYPQLDPPGLPQRTEGSLPEQYRIERDRP